LATSGAFGLEEVFESFLRRTLAHDTATDIAFVRLDSCCAEDNLFNLQEINEIMEERKITNRAARARIIFFYLFGQRIPKRRRFCPEGRKFSILSPETEYARQQLVLTLQRRAVTL
jgi:hypothetical protein